MWTGIHRAGSIRKFFIPPAGLQCIQLCSGDTRWLRLRRDPDAKVASVQVPFKQPPAAGPPATAAAAIPPPPMPPGGFSAPGGFGMLRPPAGAIPPPPTAF